MPRLLKISLLAAVATCALALVPSATAATVTYPFPSANSTVVASVGFIDADEVGYFWSAARGDLVSETFAGPFVVNRATLNVEVVQNVLNSGAEVDWAIEINGNFVGSFVVAEGFTGPILKTLKFPPMFGLLYTVTLRVTNEVPGGAGSITLAYADPFAHSIQLSQNQCPTFGTAPCWFDR